MLARADTIAQRDGARLTEGRQKALAFLLRAGRPVKAYDLLPVLGSDGAPAKPPTVYRALEFLCRYGFVHRIEQDSTYVACGHIGHEGHAHTPDLSAPAALWVCSACGAVTESAAGAVIEAARMAAKAAGFALATLVVEGKGLCAACAEARP